MTRARRTLLWSVKWLTVLVAGPPVASSSATPVAARSAVRSRKTATSGRRTGVITAVAGTGEGSRVGGPGTAGRSGMSLGIGAVMASS